MFLFIYTAVLAIIAWTFYNIAKRQGRNGYLWAIIAVTVFLATRIVGGITFVLFMYVIAHYTTWKIKPEDYTGLAFIIINILAIVLVFFVSAYLHRVPKDESYQKPPPPINFN
jgi:membrane protein implicated in regulation of membrane protease activity